MNPKAIRCLLSVWVLGLCLGLVSMPMHAQVSGATLSGTITDPQGGSVPNAKVSARNVATGVSTDTETNGSGAYALPNLPAADYEISVTAQGFSTAVAKITLTVGQKQELNLPLAVGQVEQSVQVTTEAPQVELESSTVSGEVNSTTVRELPLNGRDWASLATLQPTVVAVRTQLDPTHVGTAGRGLGNQLTINGARPSQNSYRLDGAVVNDYSNAGPGSVLGANLGVDAIQEFSVMTNNFSAEYGFTSGGVVNAITKSGSNSFHGTGFDFIRNDILDARDFFTKVPVLLAKNNLQQNQFGAAAGYRILKDKVFLFGNYEGVRKSNGLASSGTTISSNLRKGIVANTAVQGGKFSSTCSTTANTPTVANPSTVGTCDYINGGAPLAINPITAAYLALYPVGNDALAADQNSDSYPFIGQQSASENFVTGRGDYKISDKDSLFATYVRDYSTFTSPLALNIENSFEDSYRQAIIAEETHVFSASWVNTFRVAEDRTSTLSGNTPTNLVHIPAAANAALGYQVPGLPSFAPGISIGGATGTISALGGASIQDFWGQIFQVYDDAFHQAGSHGLKFGGTVMFYQANAFTPLAGYNGAVSFSSSGITNAANGASIPTYVEGNTNLGGVPANCTNTAGNTAVCTGLQTCYVPAGTNANKTLNGGVGMNSANYNSSCGSTVNFFNDEPNTAGRPFDPSEQNKHYLRSKIFGVYLQDDWKVKRTLTLNLGIRYEPSTIPTEVNNEIAVMPTPFTILPCGAPNVGVNPVGGASVNLTCPEQSVQIAQFYGNTSLGLPGAPALINNGAAQTTGADPTTALFNKYYVHNPTLKDFEPRIGFAWDVFGDGKTSIRGGIGVFDALPLPYILMLNNTSSAPFRSTWGSLGSTANSPSSTAGCDPNQVALSMLGGVGVNPPPDTCNTHSVNMVPNAAGDWPHNVLGPITALGAINNPLSRGWLYIDNDIKRNYVYQFNLNFQRQLTSDTTITIGYSGSRGYHEPFQADTINTALPVNIGHPIPGVGYYWPGCTPGEMGGVGTGLPGTTFSAGGPTGVPLTVTQGSCTTAGTANNLVYAWAGGLGTTPQTRSRLLNPSTGSMFTTQWQSQSWYDALQVNVIKRMGHGFQLQGAYTWSKSLDDSSGSAAGDTFQLSVVSLPWWDQSLQKGPSEFNVTQNLQINGTWLVPTPKNWGSVAEHLAGGWEIGGIFSTGTGVPLQPVVGSDILGEVVATDNAPFLMPGCTPQSTIDPNYRHDLTYYKTSSNPGVVATACLGLTPQTAANAPFCDTQYAGRGSYGSTAATVGTCPNIRGNLGRDSISGPGLINLNASIFKNNYIPRISEAFNIQFRAEFFNLTNRTNFAPSGNSSLLSATSGTQRVNNAATLAGFGQLNSEQGHNRIIQLALKVVW